MPDELKPCPFCGGEAKIDGTSWTTRGGKDQAWATCKKCATYGPLSPDAITAWNTRAEMDAAVKAARADALREAADVDWARGMEIRDGAPGYLTDWQRGLIAGQTAFRDAILALIDKGETE